MIGFRFDRLIQILLLVLLTACEAEDFSTQLTRNSYSSEFASECLIDEGQTDTLNGRWMRAPIPLEVPKDAFNKEERAAIATAVETWNQHFRESRGSDILSLSFTFEDQQGALNIEDPDAFCEAMIVDEEGAFERGVQVFKVRDNWKEGADRVIAITRYCYQLLGGDRGFYNAAMYLNYDKFWGNKFKQPDLETIMVHELGHLLGLDHSCEEGVTSEDGKTSCSDTQTPSSYLTAALFPVVDFDSNGMGFLRRAINSNDKARVNCLY